MSARFINVKACVLAALLVVGAAVAWAQTTVYVKRGEVALRSGPGLGDPEVTRVRQGDPLTVVTRQGSRLQVRNRAGQQGFIAAINVADTPPSASGRPVVLADNTRLGQRSSSGSIRGLNDNAVQYAKDTGASQEAIDAARLMEFAGDQISATRIEQFRREGGVVAP